MALTVLPTNIGGTNLNSITNPLASLLAPTSTPASLVYPSDLASNPAMGHAVLIQAYDYTTGLAQAFGNTNLSDVISNAQNVVSGITTALSGGGLSALSSTAQQISQNVGLAGLSTITAGSYQQQKKGSPLASISLFMPDTLAVNYDSNYGEVSMTKELGLAGKVGNAISEAGIENLKNLVVPFGYKQGIATSVLNDNLKTAALQSFNVFENPQTQLLYHGVNLRTFQLEFILTPKSSAEAQTVKNICDSFAFYSLPGVSGAQSGLPGQYLTPPQIFSIQFQFLGQSNITGSLSNIISNALTNSGLSFLTTNSNPTSTISSAPSAKVFSVNDCVLENVQIDYAPNGWASYNDGYPVQTRLNLQFKETVMPTKQSITNAAIASNYSAALNSNNNDFLDQQAAKYNGPDGESVGS
jgi:hypothetical protein